MATTTSGATASGATNRRSCRRPLAEHPLSLDGRRPSSSNCACCRGALDATVANVTEPPHTRLVIVARRRRIVLAALLAPLAMVIGLRSAWALYSCRIDGITRSECCCQGKHRPRHAPSPQSHVAAASCCDVTIQAATKAPDVRDADRSDVRAPVAVAAPAPEIPAPRFAVRAVEIDRRFARPPPVATYLVKQAFLR